MKWLDKIIARMLRVIAGGVIERKEFKKMFDKARDKEQTP